MKRLIKLLLILFPILTASFNVYAAEHSTSGICGDNLTWSLNSNGTLTIDGTGDMYNYVSTGTAWPWIPTSSTPWDDFRTNIKKVIISNGVTSIGDMAFFYCSDLTDIIIPESVTHIGSDAFYQSGLTSLKLPSNLTFIGSNAFNSCQSLKTVTIPDKITAINDGTFANCCDLMYISMPDSITHIGDEAFTFCIYLSGVTIPESVTTIGDMAFSYCPFTAINIPQNVTEIGEKAFYYCGNMLRITVDENNKAYSSIDGHLFNKDQTTLIQYAIGQSADYIVPDTVTSIADYAFYGCSRLADITITNKVTSIGDYAFYSCTALNEITISDSLTSIGDNAFNYAGISDIYYSGTEESWASISVGSENPVLSTAQIHYEHKPSLTAAVNKSDVVFTIEVEADNFYENTYIIAAGYKNNRLISNQTQKYDKYMGKTFRLYGDFDTIKVMAWSDMQSLTSSVDSITFSESDWL